ncbi:MAG: type IV secretion system DNA-binding domain-containing protein [Anaerolineae bacterium]|nr:type IV secretion system DNA-binding domain-containing protein [Anaerolineae bacterium]
MVFRRSPGLVLGRSGPWRIHPFVRVPQHARSGHLYVVGKTGKGKSKFLQACLFQDVAEGRGCGVIDPHADLVTDLLWLLNRRGVLHDPAQVERIVYVNPAESRYVIPFNVLATAGEPYEIAQNVIEAFRRTWPDSLGEAPHFSNVMLHTLLLLIRARLTLVDMPHVLVDTSFRDGLLEQANEPELTSFFHDRFDEWGRNAAVMKESTLNKVTALTMNPHLKRMLGQPENRLDFRAIMDEGKVLLADLGHCDEESQRLIGNLITTGIEQAIFSRHDIAHPDRRPFYLYIDEFQDFSASSGSVKTLSKILSGARKFGLHLTLAHQNLSQLSERMKGAVIGNVWTKVIFGVSEDDAHEFARFVGLGNVDPGIVKHDAQTDTQHPLYAPLQEQWHQWATTLANQKPRQATVRDYAGRTRQIWTLPLEGSANPDKEVASVKDAAMRRYGISMAQAKGIIGTPDDILSDKGWPMYEHETT